MKRLLLLTSLLLVINMVNAIPALKIQDQYGNDVTGSTITIYSSNKLSDLLECHLKVYNPGDVDLMVYVRKVNNTVAGNSFNSFCFGVNCYPPETDTSTDLTPIPIEGFNDSFLGDYYPNGSTGISSVTYEFYDDISTPEKVSASVTVLYAVADVIDILDEGGNLVNNGVITVQSTDTSMANIMAAKLKVKNNTSQELFMYARRIQNSVVPGTTNTFCYGVCYPPFVDTSFVVVSIPAGTTDTNFVADYTPAGMGGATSLTYEFFDNYTLGDAVTARATIIFNLSGVGMAEKYAKALSEPFPNPVNSFSTFTYTLPVQMQHAYIQVRNMLGEEVQRLELNQGSGRAVLDAGSLSPGLYLCTLVLDGQSLTTRKLVVKH